MRLPLQIWSSNREGSKGGLQSLLDTDVLAGSKGLTFWQPQPPTGYGVLGDCVTSGAAQPTFQARGPMGFEVRGKAALFVSEVLDQSFSA